MSSRNDQKIDEIASLWARMAQMFGAKWERSFGSEPNYAWSEALCDLTDKQIQRGLEAMIADGLSYPPSLPQFLKYCKAGPGPGTDTPQIRDERRSSPKTVKKYIAEMMEKLGA